MQEAANLTEDECGDEEEDEEEEEDTEVEVTHFTEAMTQDPGSLAQLYEDWTEDEEDSQEAAMQVATYGCIQIDWNILRS